MAILDYQWTFTSSKALPSSATSEYTDEVDIGAGKDAWGAAMVQNIAQGRPLYFNFTMLTSAALASGSPTLTLDLVSGSATTPTTVFQNICSAVADTTLVAGYRFSVPLKVLPSIARFLRLKVTANSAGFDAGTFAAWISDAPLGELGN